MERSFERTTPDSPLAERNSRDKRTEGTRLPASRLSARSKKFVLALNRPRPRCTLTAREPSLVAFSRSIVARSPTP
eukprot:16396-Pelagococcus_subviridis.AAC.1